MPKLAAELDNGTTSVPKIPAKPCTGIAPTTSSILSLNSKPVPKKTMIPPIAPIIIARKGDGANRFCSNCY